MEARMSTVESSLKELQYKLGQNFVAVDEKIEYVQKKLDIKLEQQSQQLKERISTIDDRLQRMEDILLFLGQRFTGSAEVPCRPEVVRHSTWPEPASRRHGTTEMEVDMESNESDFSAWVRQLRRDSSSAHSDGDDPY